MSRARTNKQRGMASNEGKGMKAWTDSFAAAATSTAVRSSETAEGGGGEAGSGEEIVLDEDDLDSEDDGFEVVSWLGFMLTDARLICGPPSEPMGRVDDYCRRVGR